MMKRALLIIDVQNEYFTGKLRVTYPGNSLANILKTMETAQRHGIPIVVIKHAAKMPDSPVFRKGSYEWELHPDVARQQFDLIIEKNLPGSFTGTDLEKWLRGRNIDTLVISGYMTQMCCDTTARQAFHLGFDVEFLSDATATLGFSNEAGSITDEELHRAILVTQQMRFSKVINTDDWINLIQTDRNN